MTMTKSISAALSVALLMAGSHAAMAAKISLTGGTFAAPVVTGPNVSQEQFGTSDLGAAAGGGVTKQHIEIHPSGELALTQAQMVVTFTIANAQIKDPLSSTSLIGVDVAGAACSPNINLSTGGTDGSTQVKFLVDTAQGCDALQLQLGALKSITGDVTVTASVKNATETLDVDNGITNNPVTYAKLVDGVTGDAAAANAFEIDLPAPSGGTKLIAVANQSDATHFVSSKMTLVVPSNTATSSADLTTAYALPVNTTSTITLSGLPSVVTGAVLVPANTGAPLTDAAVAGSSCTIAANTATCSLDAAATGTWVTQAANGLAARFTVNGTAVIDPATIAATGAVTYPVASKHVTTPDTIFSGKTVATIGSGACAAEFQSVIGANTGGFVSTIRMSNTSGTAAKVFAMATPDSGATAASNVVRLTRANTGDTQGLDANDLLQPGAALEVLGSQVETATGTSFSSWGGNTSRARVRILAETKGDANGKSLLNGPNGGNAGCVSEGFVCMGTSCTIMQQTGSGVDSTTVAKQNK